MAREYFCAYHSILDAIEPLNDAERGRLFTACLIYSKTGEVSHLGGNERFLFPALRSQIDRDIDNYDEFRKKQSQNGRKGGRPQKSTGVENVKGQKANAFEKTQPFFEETQKTQPFFGFSQKEEERERERRKRKEAKEKEEREREEKEKKNILPACLPLTRQAAGGGLIQPRPAKAMELCRYFEENCHVFNSRPLLDAITRCLLDGISPEVVIAVIDDTALASAARPAQYAVKIMDSILAEKVCDLSTYRARSEKHRKKMEDRNGKSGGNPGENRRAELPGGEHF